MEENIRDSRLWLNHSWLRVYIFEETLFRKNKQHTVKHRGNLRQFKFNPSIVFIAMQPLGPYFRENVPKVCACHPRDVIATSLTELFSMSCDHGSIIQSNCIIYPRLGLIALELRWLFSIYTILLSCVISSNENQSEYFMLSNQRSTNQLESFSILSALQGRLPASFLFQGSSEFDLMKFETRLTIQPAG